MRDNFPELRSPRLLLRRLCPADAGSLCAYRSLPEVARYQSWENFGPEDAAHLIAEQSVAEPNIPGTWFQLAIVKTDANCIIGDCGLHCPKDDPRQMEFGITLAPQFQGYRYADEAITRVLAYVFGDLQKHRVFAHVDVLNRPAIGLCRRLGFRQEAHLVENIWFKGAWGSEFVFALLMREWDIRKSATP